MKRRILKTVGFLILLGCTGLILLIGVTYYRETHLPEVKEYDAIIVLGAQVKDDGTPSVALERRLKAAWEAYQEAPCLVICCGAQGKNEPLPEGTVMKQLLMKAGIPEERVIAETQSLNTRENLINAREILRSRQIEMVLVVTSDYHVPRALALCSQLGIRAFGKGSPSKPEYFIKNHVREGLSWIKFRMESIFHATRNSD